MQRDINVARMWFEKAIALNDAEARENLNISKKRPHYMAPKSPRDERLVCRSVRRFKHRTWPQFVSAILQ